MKRKINLHIMLNENEDIKLNELMRDTGFSAAHIIRTLIMGAEIKSRPPDLAPKILREISAIGNNVNQIAKVANYSGNVGNEDLKEIKDMNITLKELSKKVRDM